jgi:putative copper export protein
LISIQTASDDSQARKIWATALLASSGLFWAVALAILILLAFFAMERHQRYLKLLEDKEN